MLTQTDPVHTGKTQTRRQILPYEISLLSTGKIMIRNTRGQVLIVSRDEIVRHLKRQDISVHDRRKYEAALKVSNGGTDF